MLPIVANSKDYQTYKDKRIDDTSTKFLSQVMLMCNMETLIYIIVL